MSERALEAWLRKQTDDPGPYSFQPLSGGNTNETIAVVTPFNQWVIRRPPPAVLSPSAHAMDREYVILSALADQSVPVPKAVALCTDPEVPQTPALVMSYVEGVALTDELPASYPSPRRSAWGIGYTVIDALAALHGVPWREAGLGDFGRPDGFLDRQVSRWRRQLSRYSVRPLPLVAELAEWLERKRPPTFGPAILHGDFHIDNCLLTREPPIDVAAIIDWEMATVGDPLVDLGLLLALWGSDRPEHPAMPRIQAISRVAGGPGREDLAARYAEKSGRDLAHLDWYMTFALWKLAVIVEGAYAQYVGGDLQTPYAAALEHDVPGLLAEASRFADR
jgi:aminoglycoside phosphotransferase (APT) family kinase protein